MNIHEKFFTKIGANYLILGITAIVFHIILVNLINIVHPEYLADVNFLSVLSSICNYILPFPLFYWLMKKLKTTRIDKRNTNIKTFIIYIGITLTLMWIGNIIGLVITALLSGAIQNEIANPVQELINSADIWTNFLIISILAPICEEIIFRKLLIDRTIKYGAKVSIVLSAMIFAFFHGNLNQFFYALFMGGFFAYVYIKTGRITYTIILHAIVNLMGSVVSLIFANAVMNLQTSFTVWDLSIILFYLLFLFGCIALGVIGLSRIKKARFNGEKTDIPLKNPLKTAFLNYGMIIFMLFFTAEMIWQVLR